MKKKVYFISGHRDIKREEFEKYYIPKLKELVTSKECVGIVVAECMGVDIMAQEWLRDNLKDLSCVTVCHMFDTPRFLATPEFNTQGGFESDIERDAWMTEHSNFDIAYIRKGRWTSGTAQNILRRYEFDA